MIRIERARLEDISAIKRVLNDTWRATYAHILPPGIIEHITTAWHAPTVLTQEVQNPTLFFGVARTEAEYVVGLVTARVSDEVLVVNRLYVVPDYQRQGIGQQLLRASYEAFPACQRVRLGVEVQNHIGVAFYRRQGFTEVGQHQEQIQNTLLEVMTMEKVLPTGLKGSTTA